jgi:hypothetical protein
MSATKPVVIMGFGRSGTTWVSDIVSKSLGGLVLFEPFHPAVQGKQEAYRFAYASGDKGMFGQALRHSTAALQGEIRARWLLRNHLPKDLDHSDPVFEEILWRECAIIGFKEIRLNGMLPWFRRENKHKLLFVIRHPLSVLASIKKRSRFWLEFGFEEHYAKFVAETFNNEALAGASIQDKRFWLGKVTSELEKSALMWAVTHELLLQDLLADDVYLLEYEKLYRDPFVETSRMLTFLGHEGRSLHPSWLFTPSMTTHRTLHGAKDMGNYLAAGERFFWKDTLTETELHMIRPILESFACPIRFELAG